MDLHAAHQRLHALRDTLLRVDQRRLRRMLDRQRGRPKDTPLPAEFERQLETASARAAQRSAGIPAIRVDEALPIHAHADTLIELIRTHPVVIVAGETGSGKSTQLPKLALAAGRGTRGWIGCTQPRRIAAKSVAKRVADELGSALGTQVGYQVRFTEQVADSSLIKFMTDGILLAETPSDRLLERYDTLIIDEAHERSLNIDFLLGYLKTLLPRRPDLKLIITSATIDTARFATHFAGAPVVEVAGRGFPVEVRYRPLEGDPEERGDRALYHGIVRAVEELGGEDGRGDILVFLPGEREIRDAHQVLARRAFPHTDIVALYARLSVAEQDRVFAPGPGRRIVLATNVAETSITVPRVRYVIDSGTARVARYSARVKVQRLHIEAVSQAAAQQRAGRCGRTAPGICIRLYDEADFQARDAYTDPEIHRASLAGVILRMLKLRLGDPQDFPFLDPPDGRRVADGYQLLVELGAVDEQRQLTVIGRQMADLPVDVRYARLLLAAREFDCLAEMLVLAAGLSIQDPRERPFDQRNAADAAHRRYADERSDFIALLRLWQVFQEQHEALSQNKLRDWARNEFLSYLRLREWRELHRQLLLIAREQGWQVNAAPASFEALHQALLRGFLTQIGERDEKGVYRGTRGVTFQVFPGSALARGKQRWLLAATLLDTEKLWALMCAKLEPQWIEPASTHLAKKRHYDPHWDAQHGRAVCFEDVNLLGLQIVSRRRVNLEPLDPDTARSLFLRHALVRGEHRVQHRLFAHNRRVQAQAAEREEQQRTRGLLHSEDTLVDWLQGRVPAEIRSLNALVKALGRAESALEVQLRFSLDLLLKPRPGADGEDFPRQVHIEQLKLPASYRFDPGAEDDGVTVDVRLDQLGRLDAARLDWLVPGLRAEKAAALIKSLPKPLRRNFVPAPDFARAFVESSPDLSRGTLADALAVFLGKVTGVTVQVTDFDLQELPHHLHLRIRLLDEHGQVLAHSRSLADLLARYGPRAQAAFAARAQGDLQRDGLRQWPDGPLPVEIRQADGSRAWPALVDQQDSVGVRVYAQVDTAATAHVSGVVRLLRLELQEDLRYWRKHLPLSKRAELNFAVIGAAEGLRLDVVDTVLEELTGQRDAQGQPTAAPELVAIRDRDSFQGLVSRLRKSLGPTASERTRLLEPVLITYGELLPRIEAPLLGYAAGNLDDARTHLRRLVFPGFARGLTAARLTHLPRYLKAIGLRLQRLLADPARDQARMLEALTLEREAEARRSALPAARLDEVRWLLEELRVSLFAQELGTAVPVSPKRIRKLLE